MATDLEASLRAARDGGRKLLVPYVTGGLADDWTEAVRAVADAGADAVEVGVPFSDPVMDGPVIQEASARALARGATPAGVVAELKGVDVGVALVAMTYYNVVFRPGVARFAGWLAEAGVSGAILPDVPLEEVGPWCEAADAEGIATVLLAAPTASEERLARICARSRGFVYGVSLLGVTGERDTLADTAGQIAKRLKALTDKPVLVGVGISTPEQAAAVCDAGADGVVVGSAIVRRLLDGAGPEGAATAVASIRAALDRG
jgi:tryptophan synthase alpha chain